MSKQIFGYMMVTAYTEAAMDLWVGFAKDYQSTLEYDITWQGNHGDFNRKVFEAVAQPDVIEVVDQPEVVEASVRSSAKPRGAHRRSWTKNDLVTLKNLSEQYISVNEMARILNRTPGAVRQKAKDLEISVGHTKGRRKW
jgi:hypothetical protein